MHELVLPKDTTVREIWRIGLVAYRNAARQELKVSWCHSAAAAAICAKYPELKERQARQHLIEAVAWASKHHRAWLDRVFLAANGSGRQIGAASGYIAIQDLK
jgi:hypothetical protein